MCRTDSLVQETIRRNFASNTVLTIAHRLQTIIDADEVIVMEGGRVIERGVPYALLNPAEAMAALAETNRLGAQIADEVSVAARTAGGAFAAMLKQTGEATAAQLTEEAKRSFLEKLTK